MTEIRKLICKNSYAEYLNNGHPVKAAQMTLGMGRD